MHGWPLSMPCRSALSHGARAVPHELAAFLAHIHTLPTAPLLTTAVLPPAAGPHLRRQHCECPALLLQPLEDRCPVILHHVFECLKRVTVHLVQRPGDLLVQLLQHSTQHSKPTAATAPSTTLSAACCEQTRLSQKSSTAARICDCMTCLLLRTCAPPPWQGDLLLCTEQKAQTPLKHEMLLLVCAPQRACTCAWQMCCCSAHGDSPAPGLPLGSLLLFPPRAA